MLQVFLSLACLAVLWSVSGADDIDLKVNPTLPPGSGKVTATAPPSAVNSSVCYKYVGCFDSYPPFDNAGGVLPLPPIEQRTVILLYTPDNKDVAYQVDWKDKGKTLKASTFNPLYPTKFVIHGFTQDEKEEWLHDMKDALLSLGPTNVFVVGWGGGAALPDYPRAVANTRLVAKQLELLIRAIMSQGMDVGRIHLIGHSLGAHISGYIGDALGGKLGRISGMDPAGPFYEGEDEKVRLNPSDAQFVDVIHTNGRPVVEAGAGMFAACGHVDFYPNGGKQQPGCKNLLSGGFDLLLNGKASAIGDLASCSHARSHYLYTESILTQGCTFIAQPCKSWDDFEKGKCGTCGGHGCSEMGYHAIEYAGRGSFYLATKGFDQSRAPDGESFCGLAYDITISPHKDAQNVVGKIDLIIKGTKGKISTPFQTNDDQALTADTKIVIVDYQKLGDLQSVEISYVRYEAWFFGIGSGPKEWKLKSILISHNGVETRFCSAAPTLVRTGESVTIPKC